MIVRTTRYTWVRTPLHVAAHRTLLARRVRCYAQKHGPPISRLTVLDVAIRAVLDRFCLCFLMIYILLLRILTFPTVMEYLGGGEIKWRTKSDNPLLRVDQTRRICRDVILGLEYRA